MRVIPIVTAILVVIGLYFLIFERDSALNFAGSNTSEAAEGAPSTADPAQVGDEVSAQMAGVSVIAMESQSREIDSAVLLRGRTESSRQVNMQAETSGQVISPPLRKGSNVSAGDVLCRLDPGTRAASVAEAKARLAEAKTRIPEAEARLAEAISRVPAMDAALSQAESQVPAMQAALTEAMARVPAAEAAVTEANARINEAQINFNAAEKLGESGYASETRVANAQATLQSALAGLQNAKSQLESTRAGVAAAKSQVEGALAGVASATSQIDGAAAGVQSAHAQVENAKAGMQSAEAAVAAAEREIAKLEITAPFAGLLETDTAEIGSLLQPGALCATIVQIDPILLVGFVPEVDVDKVHTGVMAGGRLTNGRELVGQVSFLSRVSDPLTRTFRVEIEVANADKSVSDGLTVEILIASDGRKAHLLPGSALTLDDEGNLGVRVVATDNTAQFRPVELIRDALEGVWVAGLPETATVIVTGQEYVTDGVLLDVTLREPAS